MVHDTALLRQKEACVTSFVRTPALREAPRTVKCPHSGGTAGQVERSPHRQENPVGDAIPVATLLYSTYMLETAEIDHFLGDHNEIPP